MPLSKQRKKEMIGNLADGVFYIAFILYWSLSMVWTSTAMPLLTSRGYLIGMAAVMGFLILREVLCFLWIRRYNWRDVLGLIIVCVFGYVVDRNESATIAAGYLMIFASREMDYKKIFRLAILNTVVGLLVISLLANLGYIVNECWQEGQHIRHGFGFVYTLVVPAYFLNIGIMTFAIREEKIATWQILLLLFFTICTYRWCKADLSSGLMVMLLIAMIVTKKFPSVIHSQHFFWEWTDHMAVVIYPFVVLLSLFIAWYYDASIVWMSKLDHLTRGRLSLPHDALKQFGIKIWGQEIWFVGAGLDNFGNVVNGSYNYVDNAYVNLFIRYGVVFCVIALILLVLTMHYCRIRNKRILLWMFSLMAVHGLVEDKVQMLYFNSLLLIIGQAIQDYHESKKYT